MILLILLIPLTHWILQTTLQFLQCGYRHTERMDVWTNRWTMFLSFTDAIDLSEIDDFTFFTKAIPSYQPTDQLKHCGLKPSTIWKKNP